VLFQGKDSPTHFIEAALIASVFILPSMAAKPDPAAALGFLSAAKHLGNLVLFIPQSLLLIYIIGLRGETREFHLRSPRLNDIVRALVLIPLIAGASYGGAAVAALLSGAPTPHTAPLPPDLPLPLFLPLLAASSLAVGYREELLYRIYLLRRLELAGTPKWAAAILSAALFAAGHGYQGLPGVLGAAVVGLVLAAAYFRTRSLHSLAWAHSAYDICAILSISVWT